jgi:hypothetical protein
LEDGIGRQRRSEGEGAITGYMYHRRRSSGPMCFTGRMGNRLNIIPIRNLVFSSVFTFAVALKAPPGNE